MLGRAPLVGEPTEASRRLLSARALWFLCAATVAVATAFVGSCVGAHIAALRRRHGPGVVTLSRRQSQSVVSFQEVSNGQRLAYIVLTQYPNKCVDVTGGAKQSGTAIQIWDCDTHPDMQFLVSPAGQTGYIHWAANPEMCLDVPGVGPESSEMMLWECARGKAEHLNFLMPDGDVGKLRVASDDKFCLQVIDNNITNGRWMSATECSAAPAEGTGFSIVTPVDCPWNEWAACSVNCGGGLRVRTRKVQDGQVYRCKEFKSEIEDCNTQACDDNSDAIVAHYRSAYITVTRHPSKCLDVTGGYHTNGNAIQIWDCDNHPDMQFMVLDPGEGGLIRWGTHPNVCVDAPPDGQLMLWSCNEVKKQSHMLFRLPAGDSNGMSTGSIAMLAHPERKLEVPDDNVTNGRWLQVWDGHTPVKASREFTIYSPATCEWQAWSEWSECSAECGGGTRRRNRSSRVGNKWVWSAEKQTFEAVDCGEDDVKHKCNVEKCAAITTTETKTTNTSTLTRTKTKTTSTTRTRTSTTSTSRTRSTTTTTRTVTGTTTTKTETTTTKTKTTTTTSETTTTTTGTTTSSTRTRTVTTTSVTAAEAATTAAATTATTTATTTSTAAAGAADDGAAAGAEGEGSGKARDEPCVVQLATKIEGLDFVALQAVAALTAQVKRTATARIAELAGVSEDAVDVELRQGSVIVAADIQTSAENTASVEGSAEKAASEGGTGAFASGLLTAVRDIPGIAAVQLPGQAISVGSVSKSTKDAARSPNAAIADEATPSYVDGGSSAGPSDSGGGGVAGVLVGLGLGLLSLLAVGAACYYLVPGRRGLSVGSSFDSMRAFSLLYYGDEHKGQPRSSSQEGVSYYHRQADIDIVGTGATSGTLPGGEKRPHRQSPPASIGESASPPSVVASAGFAPRQARHRPQDSPPTHVPRRAVPRSPAPVLSPGPDDLLSPAAPGSRTPKTPVPPLRPLVPGTPPVIAAPVAGTTSAWSAASSQAPTRQRAESPGPQSRNSHSPYHRTPGSTPGMRTPGQRTPGHRTPVGHHSGRRTPPSGVRSQASSSPPSADGWVSRGSRCRVAVARAAEDGNELTVREGDVLFVSNEAGKWVYGLLAGLPGTLDEDRSGEGWLPKDILETVD